LKPSFTLPPVNQATTITDNLNSNKTTISIEIHITTPVTMAKETTATVTKEATSDSLTTPT